MRFSQRIGKRPVKDVLQVESIDSDLKTRLWNTILESFLNKIDSHSYSSSDSDRAQILRIIWKEFFKRPIDTIRTYSNSPRIYEEGVIDFIRDWYHEAEWFEIYDLIEFFALLDEQILKINFTEDCNRALAVEVAGYRIVNAKIVQTTSDEEIQTIEEATRNTDKWKSINIHLTTALDLLSDRKNPDYRNSIKESISAVESFCKIITGDNSATLGKALAVLEKKHSLHGSLKSAFNALYGYTSDSGGIRHALLENDVKIEFEEAKFIIVTCSAFINYLKAIWK